MESRDQLIQITADTAAFTRARGRFVRMLARATHQLRLRENGVRYPYDHPED